MVRSATLFAAALTALAAPLAVASSSAVASAADVQNLAVNRPATGSTPCNSSETPAKAVNGSVSGGNSDKWCSSATPLNLTVDLGSSVTLSSFVVRHAGAGGESRSLDTRDYDLQVSPDGAAFTTVAQVRGNTADATTTNVSATGRFVRLHVVTPSQSGDNHARIYEFEAYGASGTPPPPPGGNLALNRPATGSAPCNSTETPDKAVNGSVSGGNSDKFCSLAATKFLQVDLGSSIKLSRITVRHAGAGGESRSLDTRDFDLQVSTDGTNFAGVAQVRGNTADVTDTAVTATGRYVRLNILQAEQGSGTGGAARIYELEVYGPAAPPPPPSGAMAAAPYMFHWANPPDAPAVMAATGVKWFSMAFMLSGGGCNPAWDSLRPLHGSVDEQIINGIRAAGGDVIVSFGGFSGNKLGPNCSDATSLAGAYQQVIDAYQLKAVDFDVENSDEFGNTTVRQRILSAVKLLKQHNPSLTAILTFGTGTGGPGSLIIGEAKSLGANVDIFTIMPFDFGGSDMFADTVSASEGLRSQLMATFGWSADTAYRHMGISSMNGMTDAGETVTQSTFTQIRDWAASHHLARLSFWAVNRDHPCPSGVPAGDTCSGIAQNDWDFTRINAGYAG